MLSDESVAVIEQLWAADHGCTVEELRRDEIVVTPHGRGIFIWSRQGAVVALPSSLAAERVVGPAFIGYADLATFVGGDEGGARLLGDGDNDAVVALREACEPRHRWPSRARSAFSATPRRCPSAAADYLRRFFSRARVVRIDRPSSVANTPAP